MRIAVFKGEFQYDAVNVFADHLAQACARHGVEPAIVDLRRPQAEVAALVAELEHAPETLGFVGFNAIGLAQRAALGLPPRRHAKPCLAWLVDHPLEHLARVAELRGDIIATIDTGHAQFLKELGLKNVVCLPHAGAAPDGGAPNRPWPNRPWAERSIRILMPGTIADPAALRAAAQAEIAAKLGAEWAKLYDDLAADPRLAFDGALIDKARRRKIAGDDGALSAARCFVMVQAIRAVRNQRRHAVVKALDEAGVAVTLCGKGWEVFAFANHQNLGPKTFAETQALFADTRFVLHVNPLFQAALHERVVYASLAGAVVLADANAVLKRTFAGPRGVIYDERDIEDLAARLADLEQTGGGDLMATAGRQRMQTEHTWDHRAKTLIETLRSKARLARVA